MFRQITVPIASDSAGVVAAQTVADGRLGLLHAAAIKHGTLGNTCQITLTDVDSGLALLVTANITADILYMPRLLTQTGAGATITGVVDRPPVGRGGLTVSVANAGNSKAGTLILLIDDGALAI